MPRTYVRKRPAPKYTQNDVANAVNAVKNKNNSYREAEQQYGVPISVIYHRIHGRKVPLEKMGPGRNPVLSEDVEKQIVLCLIARAQIGYPCDKEELKNLVGDYVKCNHISNTPFKNGVPGEDWYQSFMKRNPNISLKKPEHLQKNRKTARNPDIVYDFYEKLERLYDQHDLKSPNKASFIFNCDESGFANDPSRLRAIGEKGKPLSRVSGGSGRESTTVLLCVAADGHLFPPLIVYKGAAVQARWTSENSYPGTEYAASQNGWMEEPQFFHWFQTCFLTYVKKNRIKHALPNQTAVLIFDGHSSHMSIRIIEEAIKSNIQLVRLPSHLTDRIQPLDKCVFGPIKIKWDRKLVEHGKSQMGIGSGRLPKDKFSILLGEVLREAVKPQNVINGFVTTGLFPLDSKKFPEDLFDPVELQRYKLRKTQRAALTAHESEAGPSGLNSHSELTVSASQDTAVGQLIQPLLEPSSFTQKSLLDASEMSAKSIEPKELESVALDLSFRISHTSPEKEQTSKSIVEIFSNVIRNNNPQSSEKLSCGSSNMTKNRAPVPRLKQSNYGEVLTASEVLQRLKEAQQKKEGNTVEKKKKRSRKTEKNTTTTKKGRTEENKKGFFEENSSDNENEEDFRIMMEIENTNEINYENPDTSLLNPGSYILVDFLGGNRNKTHFSYVCVINSVQENKEYLVTGLKSVNPIKTSFIVVESDTSSITFSMIKAVLPQPTVESKDRKLVYTFPGAVAVNEKK